MTTGEFQHRISLGVSFTPQDVDYLIACAQSHYDWTCQAAGMSYEDGARENGFIKQLKLFPDHQQFWNFRKFDLTAKILEMHTQEKFGRQLFDDMIAAMKAIEKHHREILQGAPNAKSEPQDVSRS